MTLRRRVGWSLIYATCALTGWALPDFIASWAFSRPVAWGVYGPYFIGAALGFYSGWEFRSRRGDA